MSIVSRTAVKTQLKEAIDTLESLKGFSKLIPEVGSNFVYCLPEAKEPNDVAGLTGRIILIRGQAKACGEVDFGWAPFMGPVVLMAHNLDSTIRSAISLRSSPAIVKSARKKRLQTIEFNWLKDQPPPSCMPLAALQSLQFVPEVLFDRGAIGLEALVVVFDKTPQEIVHSVKKIIDGLELGE